MMIIDFIDFLSNLFSGTNFAFSFDNSWIVAIQDILNFVSWVIPLDTIIVCFTLSIALLAIRIIVAIWKLLPLT